MLHMYRRLWLHQREAEEFLLDFACLDIYCEWSEKGRVFFDRRMHSLFSSVKKVHDALSE